MFLEVRHMSGNANAPAFPLPTARRLAIHHNDAIDDNATSKSAINLSFSSPNLRSVMIYTQSNDGLQRKQEEFLYRGFQLLRVLYLHGAYIKGLPREIGELIHLRYLGCTKTSLESLPSSIGNLSDLQTLSVVSSRRIAVPSTIGKMLRLRHLQLKSEHWGEIEGDPRLKRISNLQTLSDVMAGRWMEDCLGNLTNLRKLGILLRTRTDDDVFYDSIVKLNSLESLFVEAESPFRLLVVFERLQNLRKLNLHGKIDKLPESTEFPANLTKLTLTRSRLAKDPLATLEKLKNLCILRLFTDSYWGNEMACSEQGFSRLEALHLRQLTYLKKWIVKKGAMPSLLHLRIDDCKQLKLPEGLQHVATIKKLEWRQMPYESRERFREGVGEDWLKINHIPSIDISYN